MKKIYNKLVRDKIIDILKHDVENRITTEDYQVRYMEKGEILERLKDKLVEETKELFDAYGNEDKAQLKEEVADVLEVIDAILYHNDIPREVVLALHDTKKERKGGFEAGLFLESIEYIDGKEPK